MKLPITIEYNSGKVETYTAQPPEWVKWEKSTGKLISKAADQVGISDLAFLAYHAMKRESAGKSVLPYETWLETVTDIQAGDGDPKATQKDQLEE